MAFNASWIETDEVISASTKSQLLTDPGSISRRFEGRTQECGRSWGVSALESWATISPPR
jgi:hypothetical protein